MFAMAHQKLGNEVEVATLDDPLADFSTIPGVEVHAFGPAKPNYHYEPKLEQWIKENCRSFDGVIVNGIWQYHTLAARRGVAGRRPYVVFAHGMLDPYFMRRFPLKHLKKLIYWIGFEARNLELAEAVCFTSQEEMRVAARGFPFCRRFKRVVVPYGTIGPEGSPEALKEAFGKACPEVACRRYMLFLGRIHPKKGCDLLLDAYAKTLPRGIDLVMVGPDEVDWQSELRAQASRLGIADRVHWTGTLRGAAKWGAFYGAEAFILPSHQENFGIAVADALSCGTISLISDKVNIARDVEGDGAAIVDSDTPEGTVRLIEQFLALSEADRQAMQRKARTCYEKRYALKNAAEEVYSALGIGHSNSRSSDSDTAVPIAN